MRRSRWILLLTLLVFAIVTSWLWWVRPRRVDMASYAPADSVLYLEANQPLAVVETIAGTDAWQAVERITGPITIGPRSHLLQGFIRWTGIGPIQSVILARAQIAAVVTDLGTIEEGDTLRINQQEAILIETHTSEGRIKAPFEQAIKTLAEKNYGRPTPKRITLDGVDLIEWSAPEGNRQIVAAIVGSLVIVGNSEHAVQSCLAVSQGTRQSLKGDPELDRMRLQLGGDHALTFGYVPPGNSARLLAVGLPVQAEFGPHNIISEMQRLAPDDVYSVTSYKFANPAATWQSLKTAVSSQVDALSTIVFSSLLRSSLLSYGINDPETFLSAVNGELLTLRLDENAERSILIGGVRDRATLRDLITKKMGLTPRSDHVEQIETFEDSQGEFAASFISDFIVIGSAADVRHYTAIRRGNAELNVGKLKRMTFFVPSSSSANIVTYTDDGNRVRSFISAVIAAKGAPPVPTGRIEEAIAGLPFSVTETTLGDRGIERITRSPLGQFSTVLPLLIPEQLSPTKTVEQSK